MQQLLDQQRIRIGLRRRVLHVVLHLRLLESENGSRADTGSSSRGAFSGIPGDAIIGAIRVPDHPLKGEAAWVRSKGARNPGDAAAAVWRAACAAVRSFSGV
jgi:hypothetical protein